MKIWRLVAGILSIVFFAVVSFQSCAVGVVNALEENGETSGTSGMMLGVFMLVGGIVSIVVRKAKKKGASIALIILFGLAALIGFSDGGNYDDLPIWAGWCLINMIVAVLALFTGKKKKSDKTEQSVEA